MIGAFIVCFIGIASAIFAVGLIFYTTICSIKHDTEYKKIDITTSIIVIVFIIGSILALLGI